MKILILAAILTLSLSFPGNAEDEQGKALYDNKGNFQGIAKSDSAGGWNIMSKTGELVAHVDAQGNVTDPQGRPKGHVRPAPQAKPAQ
ncbi:hypothetical protein [Fundidesulfovibrio terrae]|uniref:hypothetical protein n=1 Tax=Fundidesulfovibrio terrae TaxID=2922866 RepID=UPI001FB033F2|nr:hypothetical protein [Fundidesulfovibrio terrae]